MMTATTKNLFPIEGRRKKNGEEEAAHGRDRYSGGGGLYLRKDKLFSL